MIPWFLSVLSRGEVWVAALGLAAFLTVFWVLRGAPVGQAVSLEDDAEAPRSSYRDRVIAGVTVGIILILAGAYLAIDRGPAWSLPAFIPGFGVVLALVILNRKHRHASPSLRRTVDLATATLNASLFAGILIVVNVIAFRYGGRALDLTRENTYSLSTLTVGQVKSLKRPVTFTTFFGQGRLAGPQFERVRELLELYQAANPAMIRLEHVNPFTDLTRWDSLSKRVPDVQVTVSQGGGVVVEYGEGTTADRAVLRNVDLFEIPQDVRFNPNVETFRSNFKGEDAVTSALIRLRESKKPKVVFTTGHGEPDLDALGVDRTGSGMGLWKARLIATGSEVATVNLLTEELPAETALVIVGGPKNAFKADETARLKAYFERGGPLLILVGDAEATGLDDLLKGVNLEFRRGIIAEPRFNFRSRRDAVIVPVSKSQHPILAPLNRVSLLFLRPSPLKILAGNEAIPAGAPFLPTTLLQTSLQSWQETNLNATGPPKKDEGDASGPFPVAVAITERASKEDRTAGEPRMVVLSSRYLGDNLSIQIDAENLDLLMNSVSWLRGRPELEGIAPKTHVSLTLTADPLVRARLILVPTVMSILLILTLGLTTYLARRD